LIQALISLTAPLVHPNYGPCIKVCFCDDLVYPISMKKIILLAVAATCNIFPARAEVTYLCTELDRVSVSAQGRMSPAYPGRKLNFKWDNQSLTGDGVFFHNFYEITPMEPNGFRAVAGSEDRDDLYWLDGGILFHTAIIKYRKEPSIQSETFVCDVVAAG
jgi:hypothetical protein